MTLACLKPWQAGSTPTPKWTNVTQPRNVPVFCNLMSLFKVVLFQCCRLVVLVRAACPRVCRRSSVEMR
jgi:hypothetical protein